MSEFGRCPKCGEEVVTDMQETGEKILKEVPGEPDEIKCPRCGFSFMPGVDSETYRK